MWMSVCLCFNTQATLPRFCTNFTDILGNQVTADSIRLSLGDFRDLERKPARYAFCCSERYRAHCLTGHWTSSMAARMSQAFTATEPSITLEVDEVFPVADIIHNNSNFTDGVGDISKDMALEISRSLQSRPGNRRRFHTTPSAYQFR